MTADLGKKYLRITRLFNNFLNQLQILWDHHVMDIINNQSKKIRIRYYTLRIWARNFFSLHRNNRNILIIILLVLGSLFIYLIVPHLGWVGAKIINLDINVLSSFFTGIATLIGGVLALLFSVSLFSIQNAADKYTPTILDRFVKDKTTLFLYTFIGFSTVTVFTFSLVVEQKSTSTLLFVIIAIALLIITFGLGYWHYRRMANMVNPLKQLRTWNKESKAYINKVELYSKDMVKLQKLNLEKHPEIKDKLSEDDLLLASIHLTNPRIIESLKYKINQVISIFKSSSMKREYEVVETSLAVIQNIMISYLGARKKSTISIPTTYLLSYSVDYADFYDGIYQELREVSRIAIANANENLIRKIVDTIARIGCYSVEVVPLGDHHASPNPIASLSINYISSINEEAARHSYFDVALSSIDGINLIMQQSLDKNIPDIFDIGKESLRTIAYQGILNRKSYLVDRVVGVYAISAHKVVVADSDYSERILQYCLDEVRQITVITLPLVEDGGIQGSINVTNYLGSFYDMTKQSSVAYLTQKLLPEMKSILQHVRDAERVYHHFKAINEMMWGFYRELGNHIGKSESFMLFYCHQGIEHNINVILKVIDEPDWKYKQSELETLVTWYLSFYWVTFDNHVKITKNHYIDMVDFLSRLGMMAVKRNHLEIASSAVSNISSIYKSYLEKGDSPHFEAPRIFLKSLFVLMVANKYPSARRINDLILNELKEFQKAFVAKLISGNPPPAWLEEFKNRIVVEVKVLKRDYVMESHSRRIMQDAKEMLFSDINEEYIDELLNVVENIIKDTTAK